MMDQVRSKIIQDNPIGHGLDTFLGFFRSTCESNGIPSSSDALNELDREDLRELSICLLSTLVGLKAARLLLTEGCDKPLASDLSTLLCSALSDDFDYDLIAPLLEAAVANDFKDALIWHEAYEVVTKQALLQPISSSIESPWLHCTSDFANSSEYRQDVDRVLKRELGPLYVGVRGFRERFFGNVPGLGTASKEVYKKCMGGNRPLLSNNRWVGWPEDANEEGVLRWLAETIENLATLAESSGSSKPTSTVQRRCLVQPKQLQGCTAEHKIDVCLVNSDVRTGRRCHWKQILVPGELKRNPSADSAPKAWLDLGRYAREVLAAQDNRRYIFGFTLCGSLMRIWEFDRLGGIASEKFDVHNDAVQFISTILGFLWMSEEELGFDPTILTVDGQQYIEINRDGQTERLLIDKVIRRPRCIAGRATTCWKAYREGHPKIPVVVKESWQWTDRIEEGELLREATKKGVVNVARYYHHETVQVFGVNDDVLGCVRKGLDITTADYRPGCLSISSSISSVDTSQKSHSTAGIKRPCSQTGVLPPSKRRRCSKSPAEVSNSSLPNRIRRRVVMSDYGVPIYKASSRGALLRGFEDCIRGHQSLRNEAGALHRDISVNNMMINEDSNNPSWSGFLIDLDLSTRESRTADPGAKGKIGTRPFMAIGTLLDEEHSFMHDLESFFWVLIWICIHYHGPSPGQGRVVPEFDTWHFISMEDLPIFKTGLISDDRIFHETLTERFTDYYKPLIPWVDRLRHVVFPNRGRWREKDEGLYSSMIDVLRAAQKDEGIA